MRALLKILAVFGTLIALASPIAAATFNWSFSNVEGVVPGNVAGTLVLPDGNGTFAATSFTVSSFPVALGYSSGLPQDFAVSSSTSFNQFTVFGGIITAYRLQSNFGFGFFQLYSQPNQGTYLSSEGGQNIGSGVLDFDNNTVAIAPAVVPLPASMFVFLSGFGLLSLLRCRATTLA